ncbi:protein of unknown function [Candidatus Methylomirabilis oxygeniifera]|uniref:Uncharacterized protein n=1 Tax=Methylomirabilis oxygeniifera TaxID=671143 RepID=D5MKG4_METO1|nr:protein of unknown function [Candidatus Methylomirabilis oxyfera]
MHNPLPSHHLHSMCASDVDEAGLTAWPRAGIAGPVIYTRRQKKCPAQGILNGVPTVRCRAYRNLTINLVKFLAY